jgi:hypothetical protein
MCLPNRNLALVGQLQAFIEDDVLQIETEIEILSRGTVGVDESRCDAEECVDELALAD